MKTLLLILSVLLSFQFVTHTDPNYEAKNTKTFKVTKLTMFGDEIPMEGQKLTVSFLRTSETEGSISLQSSKLENPKLIAVSLKAESEFINIYSKSDNKKLGYLKGNSLYLSNIEGKVSSEIFANLIY